MEGLLEVLLDLISSWDKIFPQVRTAVRARVLALSLLVTLGRKTLTRAICAGQREDRDWSADYRVFSRCEWKSSELFAPMRQRGCQLIDDKIIAVGYDDTLVRKTGKKIKGSSWQRDPLSPPFCCNFVWGMRYLQASLLLPLYQKNWDTPPRALPIQFEQLPHFKKPKKKAPQEQWDEYKKLKLTYSAVLLSSVIQFKDRRQGKAFEDLPKWRRKDPQRPSCLDLLTLIRKEITQRPHRCQDLGMHVTKTAIVLRAAA
jgi:hypothetical protein